MALAIQIVLDRTSVQFLWKMARGSNFSDDFALPLKDYLVQGMGANYGPVDCGHIVLTRDGLCRSLHLSWRLEQL
jgi:hypothetical protein